MLSFCMASFEASQFEVSQPQPLLKAICDRVSAAFGILCNNRFASHSVILILSMLCLAAPATGQIVVDTRQTTGPEVTNWGWDLKGGSVPGNSDKLAKAHYADGANLVRMPIFPKAHKANSSIDEDAYLKHINAIKRIHKVNPEVQV